MNALPANLPNISTAKLPATYEAAKTALMECDRIDECMAWADKMAALASYAKQIEDEELEAIVRRIRARAIRRVGDILAEIEPAKNQHDANSRRGRAFVDAANSSTASRSAAAKAAGVSAHQSRTALRVANVPAAEFERQIEAPRPATITALAAQGKRPSVQDVLRGRDPDDFKAATHGIGALRHFTESAAKHDPAACIRGCAAHEHDEIRSLIAEAQAWIKSLSFHLETAGV